MGKVEKAIDAMWEREFDKLERAVTEAPNWEREKAVRAFSNGFFYCLALLARERRLRQRERL